MARKLEETENPANLKLQERNYREKKAKSRVLSSPSPPRLISALFAGTDHRNLVPDLLISSLALCLPILPALIGFVYKVRETSENS